ncbi:MAG: sulfatase, partial [Lentisphaerae bacterium]
YPPYLFENGQPVKIPGNTRQDFGCSPRGPESPANREKRRDREGKAVYSQDLFDRKIVEFIHQHKDKPFFLYHPSQLPHGPISIPEIAPELRHIEGLSDFEKEYASMVLRLDRTVGLIYQTLAELKLLDDTILVFVSDNGHALYYVEEGRCSGSNADREGRPFDNVFYHYTSARAGDVFDGNNGMSGCKLSSLEGGTRVPYIIRWPAGCRQAGQTSDHLLANYDFMATMAELLGIPLPSWKDGLSFLNVLRGETQPCHDFVVFAGVEGPALVTPDGWKLRYATAQRLFQLFHLPEDPQENENLAADHPQKVRELAQKLLRACDGNMYHGTAENHKALRLDEYLSGLGPEDTFPAHPPRGPQPRPRERRQPSA